MPKYLRLPAVEERFQIAHSTLYNWMNKGQFPRPVRLGVRAVGWSVDELDQWELSRIAARDGLNEEGQSL